MPVLPGLAKQIIAQYRAGLGIEGVAKQLNISVYTTRKVLNAAKIMRTKQAGSKARAAWRRGGETTVNESLAAEIEKVLELQGISALVDAAIGRIIAKRVIQRLKTLE